MAALPLLACALSLGVASLVTPSWDKPMVQKQHCVNVATFIPPGPPPGPAPPPNPWDPHPQPTPPPKPYTVKNDSRWAFTALPKGTPPAGGWPVLIDLAIIDYTPPRDALHPFRPTPKCGLDGQIPPGENPGFRRQLRGGRYPGGGMTEEYAAFATPHELMSKCSCFEKNGTYGCATTADNGHHQSPGKGCSFDILAGVMWFQRQKQFLLANGIAVMVVNTRVFDGWDIDMPSWKVGEDPAFFKQLSEDIAGGFLGPVNPKRVGFHGWSGGAQMVSNLVNVWANGNLSGIEMKAGVMMSGGTHQCYNIPPLAQAQCKDCDNSDRCMTPGCSGVGPGGPAVGPSGKVCCYMCCPQNVTETYYQQVRADPLSHRSPAGALPVPGVTKGCIFFGFRIFVGTENPAYRS